MVIIFIGKEFKYRKFIQTYLLSNFLIEKIYFFEGIEFEIEKLVSQYRELLLVTDKNSYSTIAKIMATINEDSLELKENSILIPSKATIYEKGSFLIEIGDSVINVIKVEEYIPTIFLGREIYTFHIFDYDLETANLFVKPIFESFNIDYSIYQNEGGWCEIKTKKCNPNLIKQLKGFIPHIIISNNIFEYIEKKLVQMGKKITFAESCTGGLIASYFTKVSGSSAVFDGSVVTYANEIKSEWLGVDNRTLAKFGAVSEEVVLQMLLGVLEISKSDYAIAVSGVAGPTGGTKEKPVGTVFIGVGDRDGNYFVERLQLKGSREQIQYQTLMNSIRLLLNSFREFERE